MKRKIAIYSRKSKFTGKGESIDNQIESCKIRIKTLYPNINEDDFLIYEDEGYSGGNTKRPKFQEMMNEVRENKIEIVITYKLDRISRSVADFANMYEEFNKMNTSYLSATEPYESNTPMGKAMLNIATVFAQLERETIAERIRDNMFALARTGRWLGGTTPTGYKSVECISSYLDDGRTRKARKLELIDSESEIVKTIFDKFLETKSITATETYLLQNNIKTKNGKDFRRFAIKGILTNPVYVNADSNVWNYFQNLGTEMYGEKEKYKGNCGLMVYNKTVQVDGSVHYAKKHEEWIVAVGKHKPIIKSNKWLEVQKILNQNSDKSYRKTKSHVALLSGLLYCGDCGSFMRPKMSSRLNSDGEYTYAYLCELKEKSKGVRCNNKRPNGNMLDRMVCDEIKKLSFDNSEFIKGLEKGRKELSKSTENFRQQIENYQKQVTKNEKSIENLVSSISLSNNNSSVKYLSDEIDKIHNANQNLLAEIELLKKSSKKSVLTDEEFDNFKEIIFSFAKNFDYMSIEEKRNALRLFVKKVVWDGENVHLYLIGSDETEREFLDENGEPLQLGCKRSFNVFPFPKKDSARCVNK